MGIKKIDEVYRVEYEDGTIEYHEKSVPAPVDDPGDKPDPDDPPGGGDGTVLWEWAVASTELVVRDVPSFSGAKVYTAVKDSIFQVKPQTVDGDLWVWRETREGLWVQEYDLMKDERVLSIGLPSIPDDPPDDDPEEEFDWYVVTSNYVNTREAPNTSGQAKQLLKGRQAFIKLVPSDAPDYDAAWVWGQIDMTNGDTETYKDRYVALRSADGNTVFMTAKDHDPKAVSPSLYPVVKHNDGSLRATLDGNNIRQQTGANGRRFMFMLNLNGAVLDSQFLETGANQARLIEELDRLNKPNWTHEPLYGQYIRVYVQNNEFDKDQIIKNGHEFMRVINTYRDHNNLPYIRVIFCIVDTFNAYPNMVFNEYVAQGYHWSERQNKFSVLDRPGMGNTLHGLGRRICTCHE